MDANGTSGTDGQAPGTPLTKPLILPSRRSEYSTNALSLAALLLSSNLHTPKESTRNGAFWHVFIIKSTPRKPAANAAHQKIDNSQRVFEKRTASFSEKNTAYPNSRSQHASYIFEHLIS